MSDQNSSARRRIFDTLRHKIINMELLPGSPLSENDLAQALGYSRTPVREALILLADAGLVNVVPRKGTFVSHLRPEDVLNAQFLREAIELHALETVQLPANPEILKKIDENLTRQDKAIEAGGYEFFVVDEEFHYLLLDLSGHAQLWDVVSQYKTHLDRARILGLQTRVALSRFRDEHAQIIDHVKEGDVDSAMDVMRHHLRAVLEDLSDSQERFPAIYKNAVTDSGDLL